MTHPDILAMNNFGTLEGEGKIFAYCEHCGEPLEEGWEYVTIEINGKTLYFCQKECVHEYINLQEY